MVPMTASQASATILGSLKWVVAMTMALARETASSRSRGLFSTSSGVAPPFMKIPEPTKTRLGAELHHEGGVGGSGDSAGGEVGDGELAGLGDHADELVGRAVDLGGVVELFVAEDGEGLDLADDLAHVLDGVDDVAGAGLALGADHGCAFGDAAEGFAEVAGSADEGRGEGVLVDVVDLVGGGEDLGLVDEVDAERLQAPGLRRSGRCGPWP